jgi:hypothetical protein
VKYTVEVHENLKSTLKSFFWGTSKSVYQCPKTPRQCLTSREYLRIQERLAKEKKSHMKSSEKKDFYISVKKSIITSFCSYMFSSIRRKFAKIQVQVKTKIVDQAFKTRFIQGDPLKSLPVFERSDNDNAPNSTSR